MQNMLKPILHISLLLFPFLPFSITAQEKASEALLKVSPQETHIIGQNQFMANSEASLRVIVLNHNNEKPIPNARVNINLTPKEAEETKYKLFSGRTNKLGTLDASFRVPSLPEGSYNLLVTVASNIDTETIARPVTIKKVFQILLTTDKPIYQPNQTIHIRALALRKPDLQPVGGGEIILEVEDSKGNKVFKKTATTSKFGIAAAKFTLANEINLGLYTVRAILNGSQTEKKVRVEKYVLPKFKVKLGTDKNYYLPGETVKGTVQCDYFFGKPVSDGEVEIKLSTFDVKFTEFAQVLGRTDKNGTFKFEQKLPDYFVGLPLEKGNAIMKFDVQVTDQANHTEKISQTVTISKDPINIALIPESGSLVPKVENVIFIMTTYPDGTPAAETELLVNEVGEKPAVSIKTDKLGIAKYSTVPKEEVLRPKVPFELIDTAEQKWAIFRRGKERIVVLRGEKIEDYFVTSINRGVVWLIDETRQMAIRMEVGKPPVIVATAPPALTIEVTAKDKFGNQAKKRQSFSVDLTKDNILLRSDKAIYRVGDLLKLYILSTFKKGTIYLDVIKDRQTVITKTVDIENSRGYTDLELTADLSGTLEAHAYKILPTGDIIRDTKIVYVNPATDLKIAISADKKTYLPREMSKLNFTVTDKSDRPVLAALGIEVVDESVFALAEKEPGMLQVYFTLEKELMKPRYEIHGFEVPKIITWETKPELEETKQEAARVLFASVEKLTDFTLRVNTYAERLGELMPKWVDLVNQDYSKIQQGLRKYFEKYRRYPSREEGLKVLVREGFLKESDLLDPWGRPYVTELQEGMKDYRHFVLWSLGPDGKKGTLDDISPFGRGWPKGRREQFLWGEGVVLERGLRRAPGMMPGAPMAEMAAVDLARAKAASAMPGVPEKPVLVRQFFPETLFVQPELITDGNGKASLEIKMADSITTWRLSALASSGKGELGSTSYPLLVFQDFFIDIDLPVALTQNDEVSIPIAVYNYLPSQQDIRLKLAKEDWFELLDVPEKTLKIDKNDVDGVYFRLRAKKVGMNKLTVYAYGSKMSDAIMREIEVVPDGEEIIESISDRLEKAVEKEINIPKEAIEDASNIIVKIYPGIFSQVVEGLDKVLRMPFGCFEQTSSVNYPNVLVLDYMKRTKQITPELQMKAEGFINLGYQRLLSYEVPGGGFSWFGNPPANKVLTAYGVMQFADMSKVYEVDPNVITRTQNWLIGQQEKDGTWSPDKAFLHEEAWGRIQNSNLLPTAYISWGLLESGYTGNKLEAALNYIRQNTKGLDDPYMLAIVANALIAADKKDPRLEDIFDALMDMKIEEDNKVYWKSKLPTITFSHDKTADIETTALVAYALIKTGRYPEVASKVLNFLIQSKDPYGTWHSTQATVMALKALLASIEQLTQETEAEVSVLINGKKAASWKITPQDSDVLRQVELKEFLRPEVNEVKIEFAGKGTLLYQIVRKYYLPWKKAKPPVVELISISVDYDKTELAKDDIVTCKVKITCNRPGVANMVIVDLGIPPGFQVLSEDLEKLVQSETINKFNLTGREIIVYLEKLDSQKPVEFSYRLKAKFPIRAKTPESKVYEYYNPEVKAIAQPVELVVK